jgi:hypothetical protein
MGKVKLVKDFSISWDEFNASHIVEELKNKGYTIYKKTLNNPNNSQRTHNYIGTSSSLVCGLGVAKKNHFKNLSDFLKVHDKLNEPEKDDLFLDDFPKEIVSFEDFMEALYSNEGATLAPINIGTLKLEYTVENNSHQEFVDITYTGVLTYVLGINVREWNFEIRNGNCNGTEVNYFDESIDYGLKTKYHLNPKLGRDILIHEGTSTIPIGDYENFMKKPVDVASCKEYYEGVWKLADDRWTRESVKKGSKMSREEYNSSISTSNLCSEILIPNKDCNFPIGWNKVDTVAASQMSASAITSDKINFNKTGVNIMTERRTVVVELFDDSKGVKAESSLVFSTEVVTDLTKEQVIHEVLMSGEVSEDLDAHNEMRQGQVNEDILERTGNEVFLKPAQLKDLRWVVR